MTIDRAKELGINLLGSYHLDVAKLLSEIEQLRNSHEQVCTNYNRVSFASEERGNERDQLKAENEALRKDAERYRWLRRVGGRKYGNVLPGVSGTNHIYDIGIDAEMAKEASHD